MLAAGSLAPVCDRANDPTTTLPAPENAQNHADGRSPPRRTAPAAVASGSRPTKTIECEADIERSASAVSSGKPTTTPAAKIASDSRSLRRGTGWRLTASRTAPSNAAMVARAEVRNSGGQVQDGPLASPAATG